jgi:PTH1 family peptidyl-tRNA hydrolase
VRVILGIGNPGSRYASTRHNAGFLLLDHFAETFGLKFKPSSSSYFHSVGSVQGKDFTLVKPANYVNNSGIAAKEITDRFSISLENLLIVCDDINLILGDLRIRRSGGDGGHNGLRSIIYHLNSNKFPRLRIGVNNLDLNSDIVEFVLSDFHKNEIKILNGAFDRSDVLLKNFITDGVDGMLKIHSQLRKKIN